MSAALRIRLRRFGAALLLAGMVLAFCSKSSPAYPINDWADANIYFTIGKAMTRGQVVYRDLYDHKGPLLYAAHALCALLSFSDFWGVFVMEVLLAAVFLDRARAFFEQCGLERMAWVMTAVLALAVYASPSFAEGDSAEEMALPLIMVTLLGVWRFLQSGAPRMRAGELLLHGALAGCVFWIKFTMIGLHAGLLLTALLASGSRRGGRECPRVVGWLLAGFALSTLPWLAYFGWNGAVGDWLKTYLYDNLFLYSAGESAGLLARAKQMIRCGLDWFTGNWGYSLVSLVGLGAALRRGRWQATACWLMAGLGALATFVGGKSYVYYGLVLAPCCVPGLAAIGAWARRRFAVPKWLLALACAACVALCPLLSPNPRPAYGVAMGQPRETSMQYRVAEVIRQTPDATLLNYGFMDAGFYTAAGLTPTVKYFHQTNVPLREMKDEQIRYIAEGLCDYVVTRGLAPACIDERYEPVLEVESPRFWYDSVILYRRRADAL